MGYRFRYKEPFACKVFRQVSDYRSVISSSAPRNAVYGKELELGRATVARTIFERLVREGRAVVAGDPA